MFWRLRGLCFLAFTLFLFVYARSEGDRLPTFLFYFFSSLWILSLGSFLWWRYRSSLTWLIPDRSHEAYSQLPVTITGEFPSFSLGHIEARLFLPWNLAQGQTQRVAIMVAPGSWSTDLLVPLGERGRYDIGPLTTILEGPLGLFRVRLRLGSAVGIYVTPRLLPIQDLLRSPQGLEPWSGQLSLSGQASSSARKYQTGDPWQLIHWKATARLQTLMIRETEALTDADPLLWLDLAATSNTGNPEALETSISLAASFVTEFAHQGIPLTFHATPHQPWTFSLPGGHLPSALRYLATVRADGPEPAESFAGLPVTRELLLISARLTSEMAQALEQHASSQHSQVLVLLTGPEPSSSPAYSNIEVRYYRHA